MRLVAYCRVSTDHEEQLDSLENQKTFFEDFAHLHGHELVRIYADEGISGKQLKRRDCFRQMLLDAATGEFEAVAVKDIARFARNTLDFLVAIRELKRHHVVVLFVTNNMTTYGDSEFTLTIFGAIAQEESINTSKRVRFGKKINAKKGRVPNLVYGYKRADIFTLQIEEKEAAVVQRMFQMAQDGCSMRKIATTLNAAGVPTKKGCLWEERNVRRLLQNPLYKGVMLNHKSETLDVLEGTRIVLPEDQWYAHVRPACMIVDPALFDSVQQELAHRKMLHKRTSATVQQHHSSMHLFSNLLVCGLCGGSCSRKRYRRKDNVREYWVCRRRDQGQLLENGSRCANQSHVDEVALVSFLRAYFIQAIPDIQLFLQQVERLYKAKRRKSGLQTDLSRSLYAELSRLEKARERLISLYTNELIGLEELKERQSTNQSEQQGIQDRIERLHKKEIGQIQGNDWIESTAMDILFLKDITNAGLKRLIDRIEISDNACALLYLREVKEAVAMECTGNLNQHRRNKGGQNKI